MLNDCTKNQWDDVNDKMNSCIHIHWTLYTIFNISWGWGVVKWISTLAIPRFDFRPVHPFPGPAELSAYRTVFINCRRRKIRLIEDSAKCRHLINLHIKGLCGRCLPAWGPEPHIPPPHFTLYTCILYAVNLFTQGRWEEGEWTREKGRGATVHKARSKIPTWLTVSPAYKLR
jgi:hypothetical protein